MPPSDDRRGVLKMDGVIASMLLLALGVGCLASGWVRAPDARALSATGWRKALGGRSLGLPAGGVFIVLAGLAGVWGETHVQTVRLTVADKTSAYVADIMAYTIKDTQGHKYGTSSGLWSALEIGDRVTCEATRPVLLADTLESCERASLGTRPAYPEQFRRGALELVRLGRTIPEVAELLGVPPQSLRNWMRQDDRDRGRARRRADQR
jgi:hypothetical protein